MTAAEQVLSIYQASEDRINSGKFRVVDEVVTALFLQVIEQAKELREQALKISILEMKEPKQVIQPGEYSALLSRLSRP